MELPDIYHGGHISIGTERFSPFKYICPVRRIDVTRYSPFDSVSFLHPNILYESFIYKSSSLYTQPPATWKFFVCLGIYYIILIVHDMFFICKAELAATCQIWLFNRWLRRYASSFNFSCLCVDQYPFLGHFWHSIYRGWGVSGINWLEGHSHQENNTLLGLLELLETAGLTGLTRASFKFL